MYKGQHHGMWVSVLYGKLSYQSGICVMAMSASAAAAALIAVIHSDTEKHQLVFTEMQCRCSTLHITNQRSLQFFTDTRTDMAKPITTLYVGSNNDWIVSG